MIELDGTQNKGKLGANAILSVSMATAKAAARSSVLPLFIYLREFIKSENTTLKIPTPLFNILNGGKHASGNVNFQEFMVIPASSVPYSDALSMGDSIYFSLKKILEEDNFIPLLGDEGGFGPTLSGNQEALEYLAKAIQALNLRKGFDVFMGIDAAATNFHSQQNYRIKDKAVDLSSKDLISFYATLFRKLIPCYTLKILWQKMIGMDGHSVPLQFRNKF